MVTLCSDGYDAGMIMDNGLSPEYEEGGFYNGNPEYMMGAGK